MRTKIWRLAAMAATVFAMSGPALMPVHGAFAQETGQRGGANADCRGVDDWYLAVGDLQSQLDAIANDPTVSYGTVNSEPYRQAADLMNQIEAPEVVEEAHQAISAGWSTLADSLDGINAASQGMSGGQLPTFDAQANSIYQLSEARRQLLGGFLAWTVAGVTCGITTGQFTPAEIKNCDGVADYMNAASATIGGFWNYWTQTANGTGTDTSALPLGTGELLSAAAFEDAFKLARTPAPKAAMDIQLATVTYLGSLADLYLLNLLAALATYHGADPSQFVQQHEEQLQLTQQQDVQISNDWSDLGDRCGVDTRYPYAGLPDR